VYKGKKGALQGAQKSIPPHLVALPTPAAPVPTPASAPEATTSTAPVVTASSGIHPDRQRILDMANGGAKVNTNAINNAVNKKAHVPVAKPVVAPVATTSKEGDKPEKKVKPYDKRDGSKNKLKRAREEEVRKEQEVKRVQAGVNKVLAAMGGDASDVHDVPVEGEADGEEPSKKKSKKEKRDKKAAVVAEVVAAVVPAPTTLAPLATYLTTLLPTLLSASISLATLKSQVIEKVKVEGYSEGNVEVESALWGSMHVGGKKMKVVIQ
jgi:hypothetical protein